MNSINPHLKLLIIILGSLISLAPVNAQSPVEIEIKGIVMDKQLNEAVEFATVLIADRDSKKPIMGTTTDLGGAFSLHTKATNFYLEISFLGYKKTTLNIVPPTNKIMDLKVVYLEPDVESLSEVTVTGEKSSTEFRLDKRVFNVGKDLSTTGASALEILNNVPSVNVDIEGQISLRGSRGVQILINGKPSVLASGEGNSALGTITADMIDRIEVITNPSAKYDAEGTSGILNIVLKKDEKNGMNGSITLNSGIPDNHSIGISLNKRTEKLNIFSQLGIGRRSLPEETETINRDVVNNTVLRSFRDKARNEKFYNFILGSDFFFDMNNVVTLSVNYALEIEDEPGTIDYTFFNGANEVVRAWNRRETTSADNPKWQYELQYKRDFEDHEDHDLLFSAMGSSFSKDSRSLFVEMTQIGNDEDAQEQILSDFGEVEYTFKLDYTRPFSEKYSLETGAQYVINDVFNDYGVLNLNNGDWVENPHLTNTFDYNQKVLGVYGTTSFEGDKWGVKIGLRLENTDLNTLLKNTNESKGQNYSNLFPSAHTSYKVSQLVSLQAGYSKRIFRPNLWNLNPFSIIRDNYNITMGNPDLQPEFTDSFEITSIIKLDDISLNFGIYQRYTEDVMEWVVTFEDNVTTQMPLNIGSNNTTGIEFNGKYIPNPWATLSADANFNFFKRSGNYESNSFDFTGELWSTKLNSKFKLPAAIDFEITGNYRSAFKGLAQVSEDEIFADLGLRKKILKGKGILNFSVRDVFASRKSINTTSRPEFTSRRESERGRFVTLGFSYGFGKGEAMEFSGQKRF